MHVNKGQKRIVATGLIFMVINTLVAAMLANADPFGTNSFWQNLLPLSVVPCAGILTVVVIFLVAEKVSTVLYAMGVAMFIFVFSAAVIYAVTLTSQGPERALAWGIFSLTVNIFYFSAGTIFLTTPSEEKVVSASKVRRIAS